MHFATTVRGADAYGSCAQTWKENEGNAGRGKRAAGRVPDRLDTLPEVRRHLDRQGGVGAGEVPHLRRQTEASGSRVLIRLAFPGEPFIFTASNGPHLSSAARPRASTSGVKRAAACGDAALASIDVAGKIIKA